LTCFNKRLKITASVTLGLLTRSGRLFVLLWDRR